MNIENEEIKNNEEQTTSVENDINQSENIDEATTNIDREAVEEAEKEDATKKTSDDIAATAQEFISEFSPEPIKIPNYNIEKEDIKNKKNIKKRKKKNSKKSRRRRKMVKKILSVVRAMFLVILLFCVLSGTVISLLVRVNTSEYAIENTIRKSHPETFIIGTIGKPERLNLKESASNATISDILRDNSLISVSYSDITQAVEKSSYSSFIAKNAHRVLTFLLYGERYEGIKGSDFVRALKENKSYINLVTGTELPDTICEEYGEYVDKSSAFNDLKPAALAKHKFMRHTKLISLLLSLMVLAGLIIVLMLLIVIIVAACSGHAHHVIGWGSVLSGLFVMAAGYLYTPSLSTSNVFVQNVIDALVKGFHSSALIFGGVTCVVGVLIVVLGHLLSQGDDDGYEEEIV